MQCFAAVLCPESSRSSTSDAKSDMRRILMRTFNVPTEHVATCCCKTASNCNTPKRETRCKKFPCLFIQAGVTLNGRHAAKPGFGMLPTRTVPHPQLGSSCHSGRRNVHRASVGHWIITSWGKQLRSTVHQCLYPPLPHILIKPM